MKDNDYDLIQFKEISDPEYIFYKTTNLTKEQKQSKKSFARLSTIFILILTSVSVSFYKQYKTKVFSDIMIELETVGYQQFSCLQYGNITKEIAQEKQIYIQSKNVAEFSPFMFCYCEQQYHLNSDSVYESFDLDGGKYCEDWYSKYKLILIM